MAEKKTKLNPAKELQRLKSIKNKLSAQYRTVEGRIEEIESQQALPKLKEKYEGKYFKYDNGYSSNERWDVYTYVREVTADLQFIIDAFETTTDNKCEFRVNSKERFDHLLQTEIHESVYKSALRRFKEKMLNL